MSEEPLPMHQDWDEPCTHRAAWDAVVTHTCSATLVGSDYCAECSRAIEEWVPWPCPRAHDCDACRDCLHDGHKCCGCYDGACCQIPPGDAT